MHSDYSFPVAYVSEDHAKELKDSAKARHNHDLGALLQSIDSYINENRYIYVNKSLRRFCEAWQDGYVKYVELVYDLVPNVAVDLEGKKMIYDLITLKPGSSEALLIGKDVPIEIVEVRGRRVFPVVDIGCGVFEGSRLCYVVTKKYEVVVVRSPTRGVIAYLGETLLRGELTTLIIIVGEDHVVKLTRGC